MMIFLFDKKYNELVLKLSVKFHSKCLLISTMLIKSFYLKSTRRIIAELIRIKDLDEDIGNNFKQTQLLNRYFEGNFYLF